MIVIDYFHQVISLGPVKIVYDSVLWLFLIIRFIPFLRGIKNDLPRNIYLAVFFAAIYASSVGGAIDIWIDEYDSEFRVVSGVVSAYFFVLITFSLWTRFGIGEYLSPRLATPFDFQRINLPWFIASLCGFLLLEFFLGRPTVYTLHTETFTLEGNSYLGWGRIMTRSYPVFACMIFVISLWRLSNTSFANDARLKLRTRAAVATIGIVGLHYFNVSLVTLLIMISPTLEEIAISYYQTAAIVLASVSAITIAVMGSPRGLLERMIRLRYKVRAFVLFRRISWLHRLLANTLTQLSDNNEYTFQASEKGPREHRATRIVLNINDMRRLLFQYLTDEEIQDALATRFPQYQLRYRRANDEVLTEAFLLKLAIDRSQSKQVSPQDGLPFAIVNIQSASMEDLMLFYGQVSKVLKETLKN